MYNDDEFIDFVIERLDISELLDILSPDIEEIVYGCRDKILEKREEIIDYLGVDL